MEWLVENWIILLPLAVFAALFLLMRRPAHASVGGCCAGVEREARDATRRSG